MDDAEYCRQYLSFAGKNKGRLLLKAELKKRGADESCIEAALETLSGEEESARAVLDKYMKNREFTKENLYKAFRHLLSRGFGYDAAKSALSSLGAEEEGGEEF